ncbi:membrane protein insertase YidC [Atopomonas sediminilitoris]|uniref:membrane protein insertase YidC n=1 Tax=Atopomonas sediminilitoris TaxID=2919919 RepID=UPI001F4E104C|nr:membrane protein insertase YidC [Atopomonas sediminilitoris]MCJ8169432.1 membrane protein insertase YidC [Atopomonas sediminilitoris]
MDIQRSVLLVALALVSYFLVLKWNEDYGQPQLPPAASTAQPLDNAMAQDIPALNNTAASDDVPVIANAVEAPTAVSQNANQLIRVNTGALQMAINPRGGDVVHLNLPKYPRSLQNPDVPFTLFDNGQERVYEAQSGLIGANGPDASADGRPLFTASKAEFELAEGDDQLVVDLKHSANGVNYTKRFTFTRDSYQVDVEYLIDNQSQQAWNGNLFAQIKRDNSGDPSSNSPTGMATFLGAALWTPDEPYRKLAMSDMDDEKLRVDVNGGWVAWLQHYFVTAWVPSADSQNVVQTRKDSKGNYIIGFTGQTISVAAGSHQSVNVTLYAGPKIQEVLGQLSPGLELTVDYGFLWWLAQPIFWLLEHIHALLGNWGWSIIVLTILIKLAFFPLSAASYRSMAKMRTLAPKMQSLRELHGDDRQKMSQAMMEMYKKEKINPLGGCLPILVQMPVFLALYWVLLESVEMRQAPWMFWIHDLAVMDPYFILPIIMGVSMFLQQMLNPTPPDPMQAKVMKMLPIIFTFFFLWFPAGLVLYWVVNNVLSIAQQWYITRQIEAAMANKA